MISDELHSTVPARTGHSHPDRLRWERERWEESTSTISESKISVAPIYRKEESGKKGGGEERRQSRSASIRSIGKLALAGRYLRRISYAKDLVRYRGSRKSAFAYFLPNHTHGHFAREYVHLGTRIFAMVYLRTSDAAYIYIPRPMYIYMQGHGRNVGIPGKAASWKLNDRSVLEEYARCYSAFPHWASGTTWCRNYDFV